MIGLLVAGWWCGAPPIEVLLVGLAWFRPGWAGLVLAALVVAALPAGRADRRSGELAMLDVASDIRGGMTLRSALTVEGRSPAEVARLAGAGRPWNEVAEAMSRSSWPGWATIAPVLPLAGEVGASAAPVFEAVAGMLVDDHLVRDEIRTATAGPVAQAVVVAGVPATALVWSAATGRLSESMAAGGAESVVVGAGVVATFVGVVLIGAITRRAFRWR